MRQSESPRAETFVLSSSHPLPYGGRPIGLAVDPDGDVYVAAHGTGMLHQISAAQAAR